MSAGKIVLGVLAGFAAGAVVGILFAPDKGSATRRKLMDAANDVAEDLKTKISESISNVSDQFESTINGLKDHASSGTSKVEDRFNKS